MLNDGDYRQFVLTHFVHMKGFTKSELFIDDRSSYAQSATDHIAGNFILFCGFLQNPQMRLWLSPTWISMKLSERWYRNFVKNTQG